MLEGASAQADNSLSSLRSSGEKEHGEPKALSGGSAPISIQITPPAPAPAFAPALHSLSTPTQSTPPTLPPKPQNPFQKKSTPTLIPTLPPKPILAGLPPLLSSPFPLPLSPPF